MTGQPPHICSSSALIRTALQPSRLSPGITPFPDWMQGQIFNHKLAHSAARAPRPSGPLALCVLGACPLFEWEGQAQSGKQVRCSGRRQRGEMSPQP